MRKLIALTGVALLASVAGCSAGSDGLAYAPADPGGVGEGAPLGEGTTAQSAAGLDFVLTVDGGEDEMSVSVEARNPGSRGISVVGSCSGWSVDFGLDELVGDDPGALERTFRDALDRAVGSNYSSAWGPSELPRTCTGLDVAAVDAGGNLTWDRTWRSPGGGGAPVEATLRFEAAVDDGSRDVDDVVLQSDELPQANLAMAVVVPEPDLIARAPEALELLGAEPRVVDWFDWEREDYRPVTSIKADGAIWTFLASAFGGNLEVVLDLDAGTVVSVDQPPRWDVDHSP